MLDYDSIFHFSLEIDQLKFQKYIRSDIELLILNFFNIKRQKINTKTFKKQIKRINIFPVSQSPIRSLQPNLINKIIDKFGNEYKINVVLESSSIISNYIEKNIKFQNCERLFPSTLDDLCEIIKDTEFGIFPDSGPLHFAKIMSVKGVLIVTTVGADILLNKFNTIKAISNFYKSNYCESPCGLTNLFNFENKIGCYDTLKLPKKKIIESKNLNLYQRGEMVNKYIDFMNYPVGCVYEI